MVHKKKVWIINRYAMPPQYEPRIQTIKTAHYLQEAGYEVTIFASSVMHNMDLNLIDDGSKYIERDYGDLHFVHINTCTYHKTAGFARIWSDFQFHYRVRCYAKYFEKPDVIISTTWPILTNPMLNYARRKRIKYISQSLDIWPDDFVNFGLMGKNNPMMKLLFASYRRTYEKSDALIFSWCGCYRYMREKKWDKQSGGTVDLRKMHYINNGVDIADFNRWMSEYSIDDPDLETDKKRIVYLGSIRLANNVEQLIRAAECLKDDESVQFLIYGDGDDRDLLVKYCEEHGVNNVKFKDKWIDPKYVPHVLSQSYLNILNYISSEFARYGISSSKMFQYMAAGKPIVCNINIFDCPITKNNIGVAKEFGSSEEYAEAIKSVINLPIEEYDEMCKRAKEVAKEFDYPYLTKKIVDVIESLYL